MRKKIFKSLRAITLFLIMVLSVFLLALIYTFIPDKPDFILIVSITVIADICLYVIVSNASYKIAKNIVSPLMDYESSELTYDEIKPLMSKISSQSTEIKRQSDKAKSQKLQLKSITSNMNEGLIILDKHTNVILINRCAQDILGVNEIDVKYKPFTLISGMAEFEKYISAAAKGKNSYFMLKNFSKAHQVFLSPVIENNSVNGIVVFLVDVSERQKTEQIRREFSANVSHELKTPLTSIFGYSQIITNGIAKSDDIIRFAQKIEKESSRLITLIDDIIALSNLEEKGSEAEKEFVSIGEITNEVVEDLSEKAQKRNVDFSVEGNNFEILANRRQIYELLFNLCDNAIKYNKDNGSVIIKLENKTISVSDTGMGIPEESIDRIFERFYRVDKSHSKKVNGTGLGLSIVKHIIQSNNAEIFVKSSLGNGSTFTVEFK